MWRAGRDGDILRVQTPPGNLSGAAAQSRRGGVAAAGPSSSSTTASSRRRFRLAAGTHRPSAAGQRRHGRPAVDGSRKRRVRHAGIVFNRDGEAAYIFAGESEHAYGVFGGPSWCRNWSAVSGGCFAIRREVFEQVGGFAEEPAYPRLDIDLCLRVTVQHGWRIFYNAYAQFHQVGDHAPGGLAAACARRPRLCAPLSAVGRPLLPSAARLPRRAGSSMTFGDDKAPSAHRLRGRSPRPGVVLRFLGAGDCGIEAQGRGQARHAQTAASRLVSARSSRILFMAGSIPSCAPPIICSGRTRCGPPS